MERLPTARQGDEDEYDRLSQYERLAGLFDDEKSDDETGDGLLDDPDQDKEEEE